MGMPEHEVAEVYSDGLAAAEALGQPQMRGVMVASWATARGFLGHVEEAIASADEARSIAEQCSDRELLVVTLASTYWLVIAGRLPQALARAEEMITASRGGPQPGKRHVGL
jgi:hypothetical protein